MHVHGCITSLHDHKTRNVNLCIVDPGTERFKFTFTLRDSPSDYINATCWGSEDCIKGLHSSFKICDVGEECFHS